MLPLLRLLTRRLLLLLLLELRLLRRRRRLLLLRLRRRRPVGRLRRRLLLRLLRRLLRLLLFLIPRGVRAWSGFEKRYSGGSVAGQKHNAVRTGRCNHGMTNRTLQRLRLLVCCGSGVRDLEHGKHSGRRRLATVGPGIRHG